MTTYATYNPADKTANIVLTGGDLIATVSGTDPEGVRADIPRTSGRLYTEWTDVSLHPQTLLWSPNIWIGIANATWSKSPFDVGAAFWDALFGRCLVNTVNVGFEGSWTDGDTLAMAVNLDLNLIWFSKNCGEWNLDAGADPATNTGGFDISAMTSGGVYLATGFTDWSGDSITMNSGASAWVCTPPAGYAGWSPPPPPPPPPVSQPYHIQVGLIPARVGSGGAGLG